MADPTDLTTYPIPSNSFIPASRNAQDLDSLINGGNATVTNRAGVVLDSYEKSISDAKEAYGGLTNRGLWVTLTNYAVNDLWQSNIDSTWYLVLTAYTSGATEAIDIASGNVQVHQGVSTAEGNKKYQNIFSSVSQMKSGVTNSSDEILSGTLDLVDLSAKTQGYYGGWNAIIDREPTGGAEYSLTTLQRVRDRLSDPSWVPDEWVTHYLSLGDGVTYVAIPQVNKHLNVTVAGAIPDATFTNREICTNLESATDNTDAYTAAFNYSKSIRFPKGAFAQLGRILPTGHTVVMSPETTLFLKATGSNIFRISRSTDNHIKANGAWAVAPSDYSSTSSTIYTEGIHSSSIKDLHVRYSGPLRDCYYLGDGEGIDGFNGNKNLTISGGSAMYADRNNVSWIAYEGSCSHTGMEMAFATGSQLGLGMDVEANEYDQTDGRLLVSNNYVHDNGDGSTVGGGMAVLFGNNVNFIGNVIEDNTVFGLATNAGGTEFNEGVARKQDVRGVSDFSIADGWITLSDATDDDSTAINEGDRVQFILENGATLPPEITGSSNRMCIAEVDRSGGRVRVSEYHQYDTITSFTDAGTGTLDLDPWVSDVRLNCSATGQVSNIQIESNSLARNGSQEIDVAQFSRDVDVTDNTARASIGGNPLRFQYNQDCSLNENHLYVDRDSTGSEVVANITACTRPSTLKNKLYNSRRRALNVSGVSEGSFVDDEAISGMQDTAFRFEFGESAKFSGLLISDGGNLDAGLVAFSSVTISVFEGIRAKGAATDNASSLTISSATNRQRNNLQFDGTFKTDV